eukprot:SAG22_NODE_811_length_7061_cov_84.983338_2_plen_73_part_00
MLLRGACRERGRSRAMVGGGGGPSGGRTRAGGGGEEEEEEALLTADEVAEDDDLAGLRAEAWFGALVGRLDV